MICSRFASTGGVSHLAIGPTARHGLTWIDCQTSTHPEVESSQEELGSKSQGLSWMCILKTS